MQLPSGGELYADITTGYGPECFTINGQPQAGPYHLSINYFSQGPMGYGMGLLQIQRFDGKDLTFDDRPYVIMTDHAFVELGTFDYYEWPGCQAQISPVPGIPVGVGGLDPGVVCPEGVGLSQSTIRARGAVMGPWAAAHSVGPEVVGIRRPLTCVIALTAVGQPSPGFAALAA